MWVAYQTAHYQVHNGTDSFTLHIGVYAQELAALLQSGGHDCAAFITACNPYSQLCDVQQNRWFHQRLKLELAQHGYGLLEGMGTDPDSKWPGEESLLVLGMGLEAARQTGCRFNQHAIVWAGADAIPRLILLNA